MEHIIRLLVLLGQARTDIPSKKGLTAMAVHSGDTQLSRILATESPKALQLELPLVPQGQRGTDSIGSSSSSSSNQAKQGKISPHSSEYYSVMGRLDLGSNSREQEVVSSDAQAQPTPIAPVTTAHVMYTGRTANLSDIAPLPLKFPVSLNLRTPVISNSSNMSTSTLRTLNEEGVSVLPLLKENNGRSKPENDSIGRTHSPSYVCTESDTLSSKTEMEPDGAWSGPPEKAIKVISSKLLPPKHPTGEPKRPSFTSTLSNGGGVSSDRCSSDRDLSRLVAAKVASSSLLAGVNSPSKKDKNKNKDKDSGCGSPNRDKMAPTGIDSDQDQEEADESVSPLPAPGKLGAHSPAIFASSRNRGEFLEHGRHGGGTRRAK